MYHSGLWHVDAPADTKEPEDTRDRDRSARNRGRDRDRDRERDAKGSGDRDRDRGAGIGYDYGGSDSSSRRRKRSRSPSPDLLTEEFHQEKKKRQQELFVKLATLQKKLKADDEAARVDKVEQRLNLEKQLRLQWQMTQEEKLRVEPLTRAHAWSSAL